MSTAQKRNIPVGLDLPIVHMVTERARPWHYAAGPEEIVKIAVEADRLGFHHIPCPDHPFVAKSRVPYQGEQWYEPIATLSYLAALTRQIKLLTYVMVLPYHNPFGVAKALATLDRLSGGRVIMGVGVGHAKPEFKVMKVPFEERGAITDEYIQIIKALWEQENPKFQGKYYQFADIRLAPRPHQHPRPPVWVGGFTKPAVRRAFTLGDGWIPNRITPPELREMVAYGRSIAAQGGRTDPMEIVTPVGPILTGASPSGKERKTFTGRPEDVAADLQQYIDAGATWLQATMGGESLSEFLEQMHRFVQEVRPLLP